MEKMQDKIWKKDSPKLKVKKKDHWVKEVKIHPRKDVTVF